MNRTTQVASSRDLDAEFAEMLKSFEVSPILVTFSPTLILSLGQRDRAQLGSP